MGRFVPTLRLARYARYITLPKPHGALVMHPWLVVASDTDGTKQQGTGVRLAVYINSGDAVITD